MSFFPWNKSNKKNKEKNKEKSGDIGKFFKSDITQARGMANFPNLIYYEIRTMMYMYPYKWANIYCPFS